MEKNGLMDKIISLAKRRGFIFPSSEIYGGISSCWDYGPVGVEFKNNIKRAWWKEMVAKRRDVVGLDAAIIMSPKVWEASGHLTAGFADPLVECKECHRRFRQDELEAMGKTRCPDCNGELTDSRQFNLMMKTFIGAVEDQSSVTYLRAETCQGIYVNFPSAKETMRMKIPFGIGQIGKSFRNEITPGNFIFRMREFEQMEMQFFIKPDRLADKGEKKSADWFEYWKQERMNWYLGLGVKKDNLHFRDHRDDELAHYAKKACDVEYKFPFGFKELEGIHDRGDWDLSNHAKHSGQDLSVFDEASKEKFIPQIIETSAGADRSALMLLADAYYEEEVKGEQRVVLKFHPRIAPFKVAVLPLMRKSELVAKAQEIFDLLRDKFSTQYDETGSIGKRYRRQDEIGTPLAATVDYDSLSDKKVTVRDRDTMKQERVLISKLPQYVADKIGKIII